MSSTTNYCFGRAILIAFSLAVGLNLSGADAPHAVPRAQMDDYNVMFPNMIDVSGCAGFSLQWSSQELSVDHATGNFSITWSPNEPNVMDVNGHLDATTFTASLKCHSGAGPTGNINATGTNNSYTGTYTLGAVSGPVNITLKNVGGGGGGGGGTLGVAVALSPNPAKVGDTITLKGTITPEKGHVVNAADMATLNFGDGTPAVTIGALQFLPTLKSTGFQHVYQTAGVFDVSLYLFNTGDTPGSGTTLDFFEVVGAASVAVNTATGASVTAQVSAAVVTAQVGAGAVTPRVGAGAVAALQISAASIAGAVSAQSAFEDASGTPVTSPNGPLAGFSVQQLLSSSGLFVATSQIVDPSNVSLSKIRKTVGVSDKLMGDPNGLPDPMSTAIVVKSMKGKFTFNASQPDDVRFSGQFMLPAGFSVSSSGANTMQFSIGNCVDTVHLDSKGNAPKGDRGRIKKLSVKVPQFKTGAALGGEIAKVTVEYNATNLVGSGFDTEGIVAQRGAGETGVKSATRFIQLNMIFAGVAYESLVPVGYTLSPHSDFGTIQGRH